MGVGVLICWFVSLGLLMLGCVDLGWFDFGFLSALGLCGAGVI